MKRLADAGIGALFLLLVYAVGFGLRVTTGVPAYAESMLGPEAAVAIDWGAILTEPIPVGEASWTVPSLVGVVFGAVLVAFFVVMLVVRLLVESAGVRLRWAVLLGVAAACTAAALLSIHPLLALPSVPEGPRMTLNYAFEAVGYGWVNALAYAGPLLGAAAVAWRTTPKASTSSTSADASAEPSVTDADEPAGSVSGE
ncbi:MAG: hypothetical protein AAGA54_30985 [Myxococcota bacterium]